MLACDEIIGKADDDGDDARQKLTGDQTCHRRFQLLVKLSTAVFCDDVFDDPAQHKRACQEGTLPCSHCQEEDGMERPPREALPEESEEKDKRKRRDE